VHTVQQRTAWFKKGIESGDMSAANTFEANGLSRPLGRSAFATA
jgi:predicted metalloprotease